jgi:hypothetical protein
MEILNRILENDDESAQHILDDRIYIAGKEIECVNNFESKNIGEMSVYRSETAPLKENEYVVRLDVNLENKIINLTLLKEVYYHIRII